MGALQAGGLDDAGGDARRWRPCLKKAAPSKVCWKHSQMPDRMSSKRSRGGKGTATPCDMPLAWAGPAQTESLAGRRPCDCCALHAGSWAQREAASCDSCRVLRRSARPRGSARTFQDERKRKTLSSWALAVPFRHPEPASGDAGLLLSAQFGGGYQESASPGNMVYRGAQACRLGGHDAGLIGQSPMSTTLL